VGGSGQPYLVPDFRVNGFSFSSLSMILPIVFFIDTLYDAEECASITKKLKNKNSK
jgi:hypothetical protein